MIRLLVDVIDTLVVVESPGETGEVRLKLYIT
jgi:hypothetical protein